MKRTGQRRKKRQSKHLNPELQRHQVKFQKKKLEDQESKIEEQWKRIQELEANTVTEVVELEDK